MICRRCSADIPDDGIFCPSCGARNDGLQPCPNCGRLIQEESLFCAYCGKKVGEKKPACTEAAINEKQPQEANESTAPDGTLIAPTGTPTDTNGNDGEITVGFFEFSKEIDEKTFYANALTKIALDKKTPVDIFAVGQFEPVKTEYRQYALAKGTATMSYSVMVGYDKKEARDAKGQAVDQKTPWRPFSGRYTGEYVKAVANDDQADLADAIDYVTLCASRAKKYDANTAKSPAPLAVSDAVVHGFEEEIKANAEADCKKNLPKKNKDFQCDGVVSFRAIESHVAPQYILTYQYLDKDYVLKAHAASKSVIRGDKPLKKIKVGEEVEQNKLVKAFNIITLITLLLSIASSILFPVAVKIVGGSIGVASFITYWVIRLIVTIKLRAEKVRMKKKDLITHLQNKGIAIPPQLNGEV